MKPTSPPPQEMTHIPSNFLLICLGWVCTALQEPLHLTPAALQSRRPATHTTAGPVIMPHLPLQGLAVSQGHLCAQGLGLLQILLPVPYLN